MSKILAIDLSGRSLGHRIRVEINTEDGGTQPTSGILTEWSGVHSPSPESTYSSVYRAVLTTDDGKGKAQIFLSPFSWVDVLDGLDEGPAGEDS